VRPASWLQQSRPAALVVDYAGDAALADGVVAACSLREAQHWVGDRSDDVASIPALARALREAGARAVCIVGVPSSLPLPLPLGEGRGEGSSLPLTLGEGRGEGTRSLHWLHTEHARGWLAPAGETVDSDFASQLAAAMDRGFVAADAAVLATMATTRRTASKLDFVNDPALLPQLSWGEEPRFADSARAASGSRRLDLYAIVDSAARVQQVLDAHVRTVQLRIKMPSCPDTEWHAMLRREVRHAVEACAAAGAELFINDHWQLAAELGAFGVHLGQEDLLALGVAGRAALQASGLALGVSSHSLWELCRARTLAPRYIACGPVWPTLTKAMPWVAQGLDNLAWWCRMAPAPVVAIGGVLGAEQVYDAARCGADGVCIVRGLGGSPQQVVPPLQSALEAGRAEYAAKEAKATWPHPSLATN
jgi:hydroxymethylpyrimidine kinase / phosphomethylpyrimidine kinase / thiamine-phosphate diphosphorylase